MSMTLNWDGVEQQATGLRTETAERSGRGQASRSNRPRSWMGRRVTISSLLRGNAHGFVHENKQPRGE